MALRDRPSPGAAAAIAALAVCLGAVAEPPGEPAAAEAVEVVLADFDFNPRALRLTSERPYRLRFVNKGSGGHNFSSPDFFAAAEVHPEDRAKVARGKVEVPEGQAVEVRLTPSAGSYRVRCTHFLHTAFGMKGMVTVE